MKFKTQTFAIWLVILLLTLSGLACNLSITTDKGQVTIGGTPTMEPDTDEPPTPAVTETPVSPLTPTFTPTAKAPPPTEPPVAEAPPPTVEAAPTDDAAEQAEAPAVGVETAPPTPETAPQSPAALELPPLDPRGQGLGHVGTFRQRMTVQFTGDNADYSATYHYDAEVNTGASAVHIVVSVDSAAASALPSNQVEAIWIGNQLWLKVGNQPWILIPEGVAEAQFDEQMVAADDFLPYAPPVQQVEPDEVINGVLSHHYIYNLQDCPLEYGTVSGNGDIYTAVDGNYVVRYTLDGSGTFDEYLVGSGTLRLVYDTYDVGASIDINPPRRR